MARSNSSLRKRFFLSAAAATTAAAAAALSAATTGATADIIARPPFFMPQRADNLILSGGRDAGDWETLSPLRDAGLPCYGNMCEKKGTEAAASSAMGELLERAEKEEWFRRPPRQIYDMQSGRRFFLSLERSSLERLRLSRNRKVASGQQRER